MDKIIFGKTGLSVSRIALGGIPIMRLSIDNAVKVIRSIIDLGINFIDTAYNYGDSEEKIGKAISKYPREKIIIASKSPALDNVTFTEHLNRSLDRLKVDYIDIYQHHNISNKEKMNSIFQDDGAYKGMIDALEKGKIRFLGFSSHNLKIAEEMMLTNKYSVVQIPFNFIDIEAEKRVIPLAQKLNLGIISMKPLGGGLLNNASLCFKFLLQYPDIVPDPGIEKIEEMEEIIKIVKDNKTLTKKEKEEINKIRVELGDKWCHRCTYCQPCPQGIHIPVVLVTRSIVKRLPEKEAIKSTDSLIGKSYECTECKVCIDRCPYNLNIPDLIKEMQCYWNDFKNKKKSYN